MFSLFSIFKELFTSLWSGVQSEWDLDQNVEFEMDNTFFEKKGQNQILSACDSLPLIASHKNGASWFTNHFVLV